MTGNALATLATASLEGPDLMVFIENVGGFSCAIKIVASESHAAVS